MPKLSNHSQINDTEMHVIYVIKNKLQVKWAYIIKHHMISHNKLSGGLPYARLFTKIIQSCRIYLNRDYRFHMTPRENKIIMVAANKNMGIFKDKDEIYKHRKGGSSSSYAPMLEAGPSNQMIYDKLCHNETFMAQEIRNIHQEITTIKINQNQGESEEESEDESD